MTVATTFTAEVEFKDSASIKKALFSPDLSRSFDKRSFEQGNIRANVVSILHAGAHRDRRRVENTIFRRERLVEYEHVLFPKAIDVLLPQLIVGGRADLLQIGEILAAVLAARRAGVDCDTSDLEVLKELVHLVFEFSQGSAILDATGDPDEVRARVRKALDLFDRKYFTPSLERRMSEGMVDSEATNEVSDSELDVLTLLLKARQDSSLKLDRGVILRETATYLQAGAHTSGQTLVNTFSLLFPWTEGRPDRWQRVVEDEVFAQRCVHEALRLRPTTPKAKRFAERDTEVAGVHVPAGSLVLLDLYAANVDPAVWGPDAESFDPEREVPEDEQPWGLSFGAGAHICIGRSVAAGLPVRSGSRSEHLTGLVSKMVQAVAARGVQPDPEREPERDLRTVRWTRWSSYPVRFPEAAEVTR